MMGAIFIGTLLSGCTLFKTKTPMYETSLEVWGVFDDSMDYGQVFSMYREMNPFVQDITFRKFPVEDYERELLDALAAGNGPDIFMVQNAWLPDYLNKIAPAPEGFINAKKLDEAFVDVVTEDFLVDGRVYGVPLSVDSLALYYNKDFFNSVGVTKPPQTWEEFSSIVEQLREIDNFGNIVRAGAAFGTGKNINRSADLISVLFLQSDVAMVDESGTAAQFSRFIEKNGESLNAGENALGFYTNFASPSRSVYTWNRRQHYSLDAFTEGTVGMMINYSWHYNTIKSKNEKLRFAVAPIPQLNKNRAKNFANYWGFVVAKNKTPQQRSDGRRPLPNDARIHEAWEFLKYLTMSNGKSFDLVHAFTKETKRVSLEIDPAADYLARTGKPAARRDLVEEQKTDPVLGVFAEGNIIARSWRRKNAADIDQVLVDMIESVNLGQRSVAQALNTAERRVSQLLR